MKHTFFVQEGSWAASGRLLDEKESEIPIVGSASITHYDERWVNRSTMRLLTDPPMELANEYEIRPLAPGNASTPWSSFNPSLGRMSGFFTLLGDSILSTYRSEDGAYSGAECLLQEDADTYRVWGVLFKEGEKLSSWEAVLKRA
jgi:hypothetical protein